MVVRRRWPQTLYRILRETVPRTRGGEVRCVPPASRTRMDQRPEQRLHLVGGEGAACRGRAGRSRHQEVQSQPPHLVSEDALFPDCQQCHEARHVCGGAPAGRMSWQSEGGRLLSELPADSVGPLHEERLHQEVFRPDQHRARQRTRFAEECRRTGRPEGAARLLPACGG